MYEATVSNATGAASPGKARRAILWVVQAALAAFFLMAAWPKLAGDQTMVAVFERIEIGQWFRVLTGALEIAGAVALVIPGLSGLGALLLAAIMVGAIVTHLVIGGSFVAAAVLLLATAWIAWERRSEIARLLGR